MPPLKTILGWHTSLATAVPQDDAIAVAWYRKAADQGNAMAQTNLGEMYEKGKGVPQYYMIAVTWYRKAADQGNARAQTNLGKMYEESNGVEQDYAIAMSLVMAQGCRVGRRDRSAAIWGTPDVLPT